MFIFECHFTIVNVLSSFSWTKTFRISRSLRLSGNPPYSCIFFYPFTPPASFPSPTHCLSPSLAEVNRSGDAGWGQRWARQWPCGSHLPITSVWFMSGPPQSQHSPRSTVPPALLTIINLHPNLPWHTEAYMEGPFTVCECALQRAACVRGSSNLFYACLNVCVNMCLNSPFGGGLTSVSPCWFELSDCPDCSTGRTERWLVEWRDVWTPLRVKA